MNTKQPTPSIVRWRHAIVCAALSSLAMACGNLSEPEPPAPPLNPSPASALRVASRAACVIDDQCAEGLHCFQGLCTSECVTTDECADGAQCSDRGRCVDSALIDTLPEQTGESFLQADQSSVSATTQSYASIFVESWPPSRVVRPASGDVLELEVTLSERPSDGSLAYAFTFSESEEVTAIRHAKSATRTFTLELPLENLSYAANGVASVEIVTAAGRHAIYVGDYLTLHGEYFGSFAPNELADTDLPLALKIETVPATATSFEDAQEAYVWIRTTNNALYGIADAHASEWMRAPITQQNGTWAARLGDVLPASFAPGVTDARPVTRSLRLEFDIYDPEAGQITGRIADRWNGLFDVRTRDGLREIGHATLSGRFDVARNGNFTDEPVINNAGTPTIALMQPVSDLSMCSPSVWSDVSAISGCESLTSSEGFFAVPAEIRAQCAVEMSDRALTGESLRSRILSYLDPEVANPDGISFETFLERCASASRPECKASADMLCARNAVSYAFRDVSPTSPNLNALNEAAIDLNSELFVGRKFAAFYIDTRSRLRWLRSSEAPLFLANTLRDYNLQLLETWRDSVVQPHIDNVLGTLDPAGLELLTRALSDASSIETREYILNEAISSWTAAADALTLLIERYNVIETQPSRRVSAANSIFEQTKLLYISAVEIQQLANTSGLSHTLVGIGPHLNQLLTEHGKLGVSINTLLFARDAEVVTSTSVDPNSNARSLLRERQQSAQDAIASAAVSVDRALDNAKLNELTSEVLGARYEEQILAVRDDLINLCGLREGCSAQAVMTDDSCAIDPRLMACGFTLGRGAHAEDMVTDGIVINTSEAGQALLQIQAADSALREAEIKLQNAVTTVSIASAEFVQFEAAFKQREQRRATVGTQIDSLYAEMLSLIDGNRQAALLNLQQQSKERTRRQGELADEMGSLSTLRTSAGETQIKDIAKITQATQSAERLNASAAIVSTLADMAAAVFPDSMPDTPKRLIGQLVATPLKGIVTAVLGAAYTGQALGEHFMNLKAIGLEGSFAEGGVEDDMEIQAILDNYNTLIEEDALATAQTQLIIDEANVSSAAFRNTRNALIGQLETKGQLNEANARDAFELVARRNNVIVAANEINAHIYQVEQAKILLEQSANRYNVLVQRANIQAARLETMRDRWNNLSDILGSPEVVFSFADQLNLAEGRITRAREALQDWVVALEYYAVRPFLSQRLAILLARNPQQLEAIGNELARLQSVCGGPVTEEKLDVSVRDNLLGLSYSTTNGDGVVTLPGARFLAALHRNRPPINRSIRLSASETVGQRLDRPDVLSASFSLSAHGFANLGLTCNTKISGIAVQLVGLEETDAHPVLSIVYDGLGELRSCQANIKDIVGASGATQTAFNVVTPFRTGGRAISPVAAVGKYGPQSTWNSTLEGAPLAAGYTILIDLEHPSNRDIDWSKLEDIRLMLHYNYQDMFPAGQCE